ncbi:MAG: hypothetical protein K5989_06215 [Lachnospiraceae bacterium]|nr:hypothetical protein [Lachnospiraceae bacterium]
MKIADSNIMMSSDRQYREFGGMKRGGGENSSIFFGALKENSDRMDLSQNEEEAASLGISYDKSGFSDYGKETGAVRGSSFLPTGAQSMVDFRNSLLIAILERLSGNFLKLDTGQGVANTDYSNINSLLSGRGGQTEAFYYEEENVSFQTRGQAVTEDGRTIEFNLDLEMSRTFIEYTSLNLPGTSAAMRDPLVINVGAGITTLSDQKFLFDLDADGTREEISTLGRGSGFLALDLNEDGIINDGSELFGTQSGDGFADLRKYDSDGNGWIDENDPIFEKLKVWYKNEDGEDSLIDLKAADVGAIYLGSQGTDFSLLGALGQENGRIRSTGFFLRESGGMGTVQHVDLATGSADSSSGLGDILSNSEGEALTLEGISVFAFQERNISRSNSQSREKELSDAIKSRKEKIDQMIAEAAERRKETQEQIAIAAEKRKEERDQIASSAQKNKEAKERIEAMAARRRESIKESRSRSMKSAEKKEENLKRAYESSQRRKEVFLQAAEKGEMQRQFLENSLNEKEVEVSRQDAAWNRKSSSGVADEPLPQDYLDRLFEDRPPLAV